MKWTNYEDWKAYDEWTKFRERIWFEELFYGYKWPDNGIYKWIDSKQQEQQSSNKQRSLPLKDGGKILAGNGNSTLLSITKGSNILQDKTVSIPRSPIKSLTDEQYTVALGIFTDKIRSALRKAN